MKLSRGSLFVCVLALFSAAPAYGQLSNLLPLKDGLRALGMDPAQHTKFLGLANLAGIKNVGQLSNLATIVAPDSVMGALDLTKMTGPLALTQILGNSFSLSSVLAPSQGGPLQLLSAIKGLTAILTPLQQGVSGLTYKGTNGKTVPITIASESGLKAANLANGGALAMLPLSDMSGLPLVANLLNAGGPLSLISGLSQTLTSLVSGLPIVGDLLKPLTSILSNPMNAANSIGGALNILEPVQGLLGGLTGSLTGSTGGLLGGLTGGLTGSTGGLLGGVPIVGGLLGGLPLIG